MFNSEAGNVRAYAVSGSFDDCHRLTKEAFANAALRNEVRLTSANSVNIGRLLPQMVYYFHAVAQAQQRGRPSEIVVCTPSGNFGNLTAGLMAKRAGLPIARFVAATNINDVVPAFLQSGRFEPRASVQTIANAMDVGDPSNFERMLWLYRDDRDAMRDDIAGSVHQDDEVRTTIKRVYEQRGYLLDPHSAIAYLGLTTPSRTTSDRRVGSGFSRTSDVAFGFSRTTTIGIFLATAHPAKFAEVVEPIIGRAIDTPAPLAQALARPKHILKIDATFAAVRRTLDA
jgi:threonine synthase